MSQTIRSFWWILSLPSLTQLPCSQRGYEISRHKATAWSSELHLRMKEVTIHDTSIAILISWSLAIYSQCFDLHRIELARRILEKKHIQQTVKTVYIFTIHLVNQLNWIAYMSGQDKLELKYKRFLVYGTINFPISICYLLKKAHVSLFFINRTWVTLNISDI